ncbi:MULTISPECIES: Lsr2 family protein [Rhodococcus]|uniref:Lsr2 family protein n=1 Tax=Rhodococcus opacus TaxID=37919 RepID=A0AAX3YUM5_RHOOP|nr:MULTISPECIES: Lsr2 family protein [Rhodococcus]MCZ4590493.1 Lsr2 family protein [Rhodococcus opacus]NHU49362.1 Lsr2 family protein [Rhodococcus sp. A14]WLF52111.1 Lsr2 family protein [Rhodococcus opacus]GLK38332.1 protein lsr2 precursor [Rhodococcus wratislaviensis]
MARQIVVEHVDDIDGTPIAEGKGETIAFSVNGIDYQIDLSAKNAKEFHKKLDHYIDHATKVGGRKNRSAGTLTTGDEVNRRPVRRDREHVGAVREWAREQGYDIGVRGRIPTEIADAYNAAH